MKICNKCKINKPNIEYYPRKARGKIILDTNCKGCAAARGVHLNSLGHGSWHGIKDRCLNIKGREYQRYGAKGIFVCAGLASSFKYFLSIVGEKPSSTHSIDRTDNNGSYTCGICEDCIEHGWSLNIRWATKKEQIHNRNPYITLKRKPDAGIRKNYHKWRVDVSIRGQFIYVGQFSTYQDAIVARDNFLATHNKL